HHDQENMLAAAQSQECAAQQRTAFQVEGPPGFLPHQPLHFRLARCSWQWFQVHLDENGRRLRRYDLLEPAVGYPNGGAQDLVPANDFSEAAPQCINVQFSLDLKRDRNIAGGISRFQAMQEPQWSLGE